MEALNQSIACLKSCMSRARQKAMSQ
jgi:hypothetical protein